MKKKIRYPGKVKKTAAITATITAIIMHQRQHRIALTHMVLMKRNAEEDDEEDDAEEPDNENNENEMTMKVKMMKMTLQQQLKHITGEILNIFQTQKLHRRLPQ